MKNLIIALILSASPAFATEIDFAKPLLDFDGATIPSAPSANAPPMDLEMVAERALLDPTTDPRKPALSPDDKLKRYNMAMDIHAKKKLDLSAEQVTFLKSVIGELWPAMIVGRAFEILDPSKPK